MTYSMNNIGPLRSIERDILFVQIVQEKFLSQPFGQRLYRFAIYTFRRSASCPSQWSPRKLILASPSQEITERWSAIIGNAASEAKPRRPRKLLVLINPVGGSRKASKVFERVVAPVFARAQIETDVRDTQFAGHAQDMLMDMSVEELESLDGIVAVGGDGLFNEIINALLDIRAMGSRPGKTVEATDSDGHCNKMGNGITTEGSIDHCDPKDASVNITFSKFNEKSIAWATAAAALRVGHIPAGSTDAVACSLNGTRSVFSAAMRIALGDGVPLDVVRIDAADRSKRFAVCMASYGFMGDLMRESERLRYGRLHTIVSTIKHSFCILSLLLFAVV